MVQVQIKGKYNITYKQIQYSFDANKIYDLEKSVAEMLVNSDFASYVKNESSKSKKSNNNKQ